MDWVEQVEMDLVDFKRLVATGTVGVKYPWKKSEELGRGSFGTVYAAVDSNRMCFAVKEIRVDKGDQRVRQCIVQLKKEVEMLRKLKHENIVQYLGADTEPFNKLWNLYSLAPGELYIFEELVRPGSLATICRSSGFTDSQISAYTKEILKGLKYLHDRSIVHRDIKCADILVDTDEICKLADFGVAKQLNCLDQRKSCKGSAHWMAPEVIDPKNISGLPADIWSLGCTIL
ncbi:unnamed protein product [Calypogeia fissa]